MIITKTPLRISFFGGGTDFFDYFSKHGGAVLSTSINKYMYITVNATFNDEIILKYSTTEKVRTVDEVQHPLIRECLKLVGIRSGVEITSMADIPGATGLGSSSSFTVGLLNALHAFKKEYVSQSQLASEAIKIECNILKSTPGWQDQVAAAKGGFNLIEFGDGFQTTRVVCLDSVKKSVEENCLLFFIGNVSDNKNLLVQQNESVKNNLVPLAKMKDLAVSAFSSLCRNNIRSFGDWLKQNWEYKKKLHEEISNPTIDQYADLAMKKGAEGYKVCGAGGRGFLLVYAQRGHHSIITKTLWLKGLKPISFGFENEGSRVILYEA